MQNIIKITDEACKIVNKANKQTAAFALSAPSPRAMEKQAFTAQNFIKTKWRMDEHFSSIRRYNFIVADELVTNLHFQKQASW